MNNSATRKRSARKYPPKFIADRYCLHSDRKQKDFKNEKDFIIIIFITYMANKHPAEWVYSFYEYK